MQSSENSLKNELYARLWSSIPTECKSTATNSGAGDLSHFAADPVGFVEEILGEQLTDDVQKMMLSVRDHGITVAKSANATGKTHGAARTAAWWYSVFQNCQVYTAAAPPESNLKNILWGEIGGLREKHPALFQGDTVKELHIARGAQVFLTGVTIPSSGTEAQREAKFSGKHSPALLFIIDEGDAVPDEVFKGIESCMSGGHARLLIMHNPRHPSGAPHRFERDGIANVVHLSAFSHPNVLTGEDRIPGAVTRETTVRRINQWCRPLAEDEATGDDCFRLPEFLEGATAKSQSGTVYPPLKAGWYRIEEPAFATMVLGQYPSQAENQLISREWINRARQRWDVYVAERGETPPPYMTGTAGLDVAEFGADANVLCCRYGGFVPRMETWGGMDPVASGDRAAALLTDRLIDVCHVDATGVGSGTAPAMQRKGLSANPVKTASKPTKTTELGDFGTLRDQLLWSVREWLRTDPGAMLPRDEQLSEELAVGTYEIRNGKLKVMDKRTMRELLKRSPDRLDALALTFAPAGFFAGLDLT